MRLQRKKKQKPEWRSVRKEKDGLKHRMIKAIAGKKLYQCLRCGKRSIYGNVPGACCGLMWVNGNKNREIDLRRRWKDKFMVGHHLQRIVDVDKVRTLRWYRKCAGWTTPNKLGKAFEVPMQAQGSKGAVSA